MARDAVDKLETGAMIVLGCLGAYAGYKILSAVGDGAKAAGAALNPANENNIVNKAVTKLAQVATGNTRATPGSLIYDKLNPNQASYDLNSGKPLVADTPGINAAKILAPTLPVVGAAATALNIAGATVKADAQVVAPWLASLFNSTYANYDPSAPAGKPGALQ
jgi:hypothetical protein